jgi:hypothetical protein
MVTVSESVSHGLDSKTTFAALTALKKGDFTRSITPGMDRTGRPDRRRLQRCDRANERMASELARLSRVVGKEGKISGARIAGRSLRLLGESIDSVNALIGDWCIPRAKRPA